MNAFFSLVKRSFSCHFPRALLAVLGGFVFLALFSLLPLPSSILQADMLWNAFLALLPLGFALCAVLIQRRPAKPTWLKAVFWVLCVLWAAFFPNGPYMLTDLIHLSRFSYDVVNSRLAWLGLFHIVAAVTTGCTSGFLSLRLMQETVKERFGGKAGWLFCAVFSILAGIAIFIGRFLRFNSWDLLFRPNALLSALASLSPGYALSMSALFAVAVLCLYLFFFLLSPCPFPARHPSIDKKPS